MMGGAEDLPKRASSPLKRVASDFEEDVSSNQKEDVDMISVPAQRNCPNTADSSTHASRTQRAQSVDMLKNGDLASTSNGSDEEASQRMTPVNAEAELPSIDVQIKTITTMCEAYAENQPNEGDKVFLVSKLWLKRVESRGTEALKNSKVKPEGDAGPIDNSDIIQQIMKDCDGIEFVQLKRGMSQNEFVLFPEDAWTLVNEWYGLMLGSMPIERFAHNTNPDKNGIPNVLFEFHPPIFTIHRLWSEISGINIPQAVKASHQSAPIIFISRSARYYEFLKRAKEKTGIDLSRKVRVWRVPRVQPAAEPVTSAANNTTPPSSRPTSPTYGPELPVNQRGPQDSWTETLLDVESFTQLERGTGRELLDQDDVTANPNYNGSQNLHMVGLADSETIVLDESAEGKSFVSNYTGKSSKSTTSNALARTGISNSAPTSGRSSPAPQGPMTRGRTQKTGRMAGTVGLSNLGNTCYMNSALQCVRSVEELTKYFLNGNWKEELNDSNPLGNNGEVAVFYGKLLEEIYKEPTPTSVSPSQFKRIIGKYAPSFSGYGQQDSQEFLGFLLDGLQEDLSRVKKKPYIEKPDSTDDMINNPDAIREMASKVWDITKKRDDSVIADLFTGMYKSTLVCPTCNKISITFDPFNNLTLQLPIENTWSHSVYYFPLNDKPVLISVDMDKQGSILAMKQYISSKVGVPVERLFAAEEFKCKFYKVFDDFGTASDDIGQNDNCAVYELEAKPTNWPAPKKAKRSNIASYGSNDSEDDIPSDWDTPLAERMLVPVFHRRPNSETSRFRKPWVLIPVPHFVILNPEEARNEDMIRRKILEKVATFTTHQDFVESDEGSSSVNESVDPDVVLTNGSDSSGDNKIVAKSIDGEDEMVDITVKERNRNENKNAKISEIQQPRFNSRRPKFINSGTFIEPGFQNMFSLGFLLGGKEMIPTGWNTVDEDKTYPTISSRNSHHSQVRRRESTERFDTNGRNGSESSEEDEDNHENYHGNVFSSTRMTEEASESSDEDELAGSPKALPVRTAAPKSGVRVGYSKRGVRRIKTYSRKEQLPGKIQEIEGDNQEAFDHGPLIRLGEGIVVDWNQEAFDTMFLGSEGDELRGRDTYSAIPTFEDPELALKRDARQRRRKNGITLTDCLNEFGKEEILSEQDTWYCPKCKEHRRASKKFELWKTPDILVMHLKRFSSSAYRRDKLDVLVDFPLENLDLTSRVVEAEDGKPEIFDLFAVDDHWGGLGGGHYTAFAKNFKDHEWYEYNDSSVSKLTDLSRIVTQSAYLLFYRRRSDVPLGGPRFQQIIQSYDNPPEPSEDEASESGEDQGLVVNSSLHGSSSALTGVEAIRHQDGFHGEEMMTVNPLDLDQLPDYQAHELDSRAPPTLHSGVTMNDGLRASIEEDEGINMDYSNTISNNFHAINQHHSQNSWSFNTLDDIGRNSRGNNMVSGTGSDVDAASDLVEDNSSASEGSRRGRLEDFDNVNAEDSDGPYVDQSPIPDLDEEGQAGAIALHHDLLENLNRGNAAEYASHHQVPVDDDNELDEPATEIHIGDNED